jgi:hypothetical protein
MVLASMYPSSLAFPCDEHPCDGGLDEPKLASEAQFDDDTLGGVRGLPDCGRVAVAITTSVEVAECGANHKMVNDPIRLSWVSGSGREPDHQNRNIKLARAVSGPENLTLAPKSGSGFSSQCRRIPHAQPPLASMSRASASLFETKLCQARKKVQAEKARVRNSARHCAERK